MTKEALKVLTKISELQERLFWAGYIKSLDDPVGVAPTYVNAAGRAIKKGLLTRVGDGYQLTETGKQALGMATLSEPEEE